MERKLAKVIVGSLAVVGASLTTAGIIRGIKHCKCRNEELMETGLEDVSGKVLNAYIKISKDLSKSEMLDLAILLSEPDVGSSVQAEINARSEEDQKRTWLFSRKKSRKPKSGQEKEDTIPEDTHPQDNVQHDWDDLERFFSSDDYPESDQDQGDVYPLDPEFLEGEAIPPRNK